MSVELLGAGGSDGLATADVSREGLFLHSRDPKPLRQLLRLRIDPGDGSEPIVGHGMVVRVVESGSSPLGDESPGMGIEFYGFGGEPLRRWQELITRLESSGALELGVRCSKPPPAGLQPLVCDAAHRLPGRENVLLLLSISNVEQLYEFHEHRLPAGEAFVETQVRLLPGAQVDLRLTHPLSRAVYDFKGTVTAFEEGDRPGLTINFLAGPETRKETFATFIEEGLPVEELTLELVED